MRNYLSLREAAALSGMSPRLVLELCRAGIIRARNVQGRWWVHVGDFAVWVGGTARQEDR
jgi:hypothetical protein